MAEHWTRAWLDAVLPRPARRVLLHLWRAIILLAGAMAASEAAGSEDPWWALAAFILFAIYATSADLIPQ